MQELGRAVHDVARIYDLKTALSMTPKQLSEALKYEAERRAEEKASASIDLMSAVRLAVGDHKPFKEAVEKLEDVINGR